jgi:hypothetical protein
VTVFAHHGGGRINPKDCSRQTLRPSASIKNHELLKALFKLADTRSAISSPHQGDILEERCQSRLCAGRSGAIDSDSRGPSEAARPSDEPLCGPDEIITISECVWRLRAQAKRRLISTIERRNSVMPLYLPKTPTAQKYKVIMDAIDTAQHSWNTYVTQLGRGYREAYKKHDKAIGDIKEKYRLAAESAYWVLSLLCVSFAGGMVGGLMAPWVNRAGESAAKDAIDSATRQRNFVSGTVGGITTGVTQKGIDATKPDPQDFKPAVKEPLDYWQDLFGEVGLCCGALRDEVQERMKLVDNASFPLGWEDDVMKLMDVPLLKDIPSRSDMPDPAKVEREAELGMWIAWANVRDIDYWKTRIDTVANEDAGRRKKGIYMDELRKLQPVVDRLKDLGALPLGTRTVNKPMVVGSQKETFLDIPKLRIAGSGPGGSVFLGKVADVVKNPRTVLPQLENLAPKHKRAA